MILQICATEVDFWSIYNHNPSKLKLMEDEKIYPPRFEVLIAGEAAVECGLLCVEFHGAEEQLRVEVPLPLPQGKLPILDNTMSP